MPAVELVVEVVLARAVGGEDAYARVPQPPHGLLDGYADGHRQMEERAHGRAHGLGVVQVHGGVGEDDRVGARGVGAAQHRTGVPGVPYVRQDGDQLRPGGDDGFEGRVQEAADADQALRGDGLGHVGQDLAVGEMHPGARRVGGLDDGFVPLGGLDGDEELDEGRLAVAAAVVRCLTYGLRPLGDEPALLAAEVAPGQPPGGGDPWRSRGDQFGGDHVGGEPLW